MENDIRGNHSCIFKINPRHLIPGPNTISIPRISRAWSGLSPPSAIRWWAVCDPDPIDPLIAYLRTNEKSSVTSGKIIYNCLRSDEWGEALPIRASFRHGYPPRSSTASSGSGANTAFSDANSY